MRKKYLLLKKTKKKDLLAKFGELTHSIFVEFTPSWYRITKHGNFLQPELPPNLLSVNLLQEDYQDMT